MNTKCFMVEPQGDVASDDSVKWKNMVSGELYDSHMDAPVGAMFYLPCGHPHNPELGSSEYRALPMDERKKGHLFVRCPEPGGIWGIDNAATGKSSGWTRTGTVPNITVRPSILFPQGGYHAFLTNGELIPC